MKGEYRALVTVVTVVAALMTPVRLRLAVQDQPQTKRPRYILDTASYNFLTGSGFLCGTDDSTACSVLARAGNGQTIEISAAGALGFANKSVTAAGAFATSYFDTGLSPSTTYTYTVSPDDLTGNVSAQSTAARTTTQGNVAVVHHYEYVVNDGSLTVYDIDALPTVSVVKTEIIPNGSGTRGAAACGNTLWVSYGSDSTQSLSNTPSLLAYDLVNDVVKWTHSYSFGVDSMSVTPDCKWIYMPEGELSSGGLWYVIDAATGSPTAVTINSLGSGPHNTIIPPNGQHVYMGPRFTANLVEGSISTNSVIRQIGPETAGSSAGIRPFTIDGTESTAFVTLSGYLGFQVFNINTGALTYTVPVPGYSCSGGQTSAGATSCAHGISISPNGKEIYLIDAGNTANHVHVFDVSGLPNTAPSLVNTITLNTPLSGNESPCAYDCLRDGWIHHSLDGRYVFVGDSGDVVDTATRSVIATLPAMTNTRKEIEIDFQSGLVVAAMTNRSSIGAATTTDTTPPSVPTGLAATAFSSSQINLSWTASTDPDSPVAGYKIYRNSLQIATVSDTSYSDIGLSPSTTYTYTVSAFDPAGNISAQSTAASATTQGATPLSVAPNPLNFPGTAIGSTSGTLNVTLTNSTAVNVTISAAPAIGGTNASEFAIVTGTTSCNNGTVVAANGGSCQVSLNFKPTATGNQTATLTLADTGENPNNSPHVVTLNGAGTAPSASLSPNSVNFNNQGLGTASSAQTVTVTNSGDSPLNITGVALSGANMADFAIASNSTCTNSSAVAVGANCVINLTFTPAATGNRVATLSITDNAAGSPQTVSLSGTGIDFNVSGPSTPISTAVGQPAMATITITPGPNGFPNLVSFSASNLPPFSSASFSPPSVTPMDAAVTTVLTITTKNQGAGPVKGNTLLPLTGPLPGLWLSGALLALLSLVLSRRVARTQRPAAYLAVALLLCCGSVLVGCSSSSHGTPAATYKVTVTATSDQLSHSTTVTVVVQ